MAAERWRQIEELYRAAQERGRVVLSDADPELRREVESLLDQDSECKLLDRPAEMLLEQSTATDPAGLPSGAGCAFDAESAIVDTGTKPTALLDSAGEVSANESADLRKRCPPWWMWLIAAAFLTHILFIGAVCFFGPEPAGLALTVADEHPLVSAIAENSPAERAGLRSGDRLLSAGGRPIGRILDWDFFLANVEAGRTYRIEVLRGGQPLVSSLPLGTRPAGYWLTAKGLARCCGLLASLCYLAVACFMAFMRPGHLLVRMGALSLAIGSSFLMNPVEGLDTMFRQWPPWTQVLLWLSIFLSTIGLAVGFTFFALFPHPSFRRRWLWTAAWLPVLVMAPFLDYQVVTHVYDLTLTWPDWLNPASQAYWVTYVPLSFALLAIKYRRLTDVTEKRRVRVVVAGLAAVLMLPLPVGIYSVPGFESAPGAWFFLSVPVTVLASLLACALPLSFAYAILRHQLFDIRVMVRQGLRYAAARRLLLLAAPVIVALFVLDLYNHKERRIDEVLRDRGWIYAILTGAAALLHLQRQRWLQALDRRFFRDQYNAHQILRATLEKVYAAANLTQVAPTVIQQLEAALHVQFCAIVEREPGKKLYRPVAVCPDQFRLPPLPVGSKIVELSKLLAKPVAVSPDESRWLERQLPKNEWRQILSSGISLLAPVQSPHHDALLLLGKKRSEEPFTSEDVRFIEDVTIGLSLLSRRPSASFEPCAECPACGRCYQTSLEICPDDGSKLATIPLPYCLDERFRLQRRIGKGGMGVVYEATDLQLQRKVAVKVISQDRISSPDAVERFRRESRVLAGFQHPNVVTLYDIGITSQGQPFLVMELLSGITLRQELQRRKRLPIGEINNIVHQVCAALSAAHRRSLIHRDLKPENIFLCDAQEDSCSHSTGDRTAKILDFGLAKLGSAPAKGENDAMFSTETGKIAGTPAYLPPEALFGERARQGADIWALSVLTREMVMGQNPFTQDAVATAATSQDRLPQAWHDFFESCLARDPARETRLCRNIPGKVRQDFPVIREDAAHRWVSSDDLGVIHCLWMDSVGSSGG